MLRYVYHLLSPKSLHEDTRRIELILNVLLLSVVSLILVAIVVTLAINLFFGRLARQEDAPAFISLIVQLLVFVGLYVLSRKGYIYTASYIFIGLLFLLATYLWLVWGIDAQIGILAQVLVILMSGILVSTRFAFLSTGIISLVMLALWYLHAVGALAVNVSWKATPWKISDVFVVAVIFLVISTVSWLSNREIEKSLTRARASEGALKKERDSLEVTLEARTRELKEAQVEKMAQLYRFAEFGRLSSGMFHDLVNPLNAVSLSVERIKESEHVVAEVKPYVDRAILATKKMEDFVAAVRKQLAREETSARFCVNDEIAQVVEVLGHKSIASKVAMKATLEETIYLVGDAIKFHHAMLNLVSNAIDSYQRKALAQALVAIHLKKDGENVVVMVQDWGEGIPHEHLEKIFEPFFTTKKEHDGVGIGLSLTKRIVEKDFKGTIRAVSEAGKGSTFTLTIPLVRT